MNAMAPRHTPIASGAGRQFAAMARDYWNSERKWLARIQSYRPVRDPLPEA